MSDLLATLHKWAEGINARHGVNPWVFFGLMVGCAPIFYYSIYRLGRAAVKRDSGQLNVWGAVFLAATALPYLYVMVFGRNLPWYIYLVLGALLAQGLWSLLRRRRRAAEGEK